MEAPRGRTPKDQSNGISTGRQITEYGSPFGPLAQNCRLRTRTVYPCGTVGVGAAATAGLGVMQLS